jgi:hypothetical protein
VQPSDIKYIREAYRVTAGDAAQASLGRVYTTNGWIHDPQDVNKPDIKPELWKIHHVMLRVTTGGYVKRGIVGKLWTGTTTARETLYLATDPPMVIGDAGMQLKHYPIYVTNGLGWRFNTPALADWDLVWMFFSYEVVR